MTALTQLAGSRELLINLTLRDLRGRYRRSALGWAWSLANPLVNMLIFSLVFRVFLRVPVERGVFSGLQNFPLFLIIGLVFWNFFSIGVTGSMSALLANANLIKKVYFPRHVIVLSAVGSAAVTLLIEAGVVSLVLMIAGNFVLPWLPIVLFFIVVQAAFVTGVALMLSVLNVYFRDLEYLTSLVLQMVFYATPVVYPLSLVPERATILGMAIPVRTIYTMNPMVRFVEIFRDCLYHLRMPGAKETLYVVVVAGATLLIGALVFNRLQRRLAEEL